MSDFPLRKRDHQDPGTLEVSVRSLSLSYPALCGMRLARIPVTNPNFKGDSKLEARHDRHQNTEEHSPGRCKCRNSGCHWSGTECSCHADARILRCRVSDFGTLFGILGLCAGKWSPAFLVNMAVHEGESHIS